MKGVRLGLAICVIGGVMLFGTERRSRAGVPADSEPQDIVVRLESPSTFPAPIASVDPKADNQLFSSLGLKTPATPIDRQASSCPDGMVEVEGDFCPNLEQKCLRWLDPETRMRCAEFAPTGACQGK